LIEALTYRHSGHSRTDPAKYRPAGELETWQERDPITRLRRRLEAAGTSPQRLDEIETEVETEVEAASEEALAAPLPDAGELFTDVYCRNGTTWRN
jgi:pyruvate dehydrogenase E1 component alpha subunit